MAQVDRYKFWRGLVVRKGADVTEWTGLKILAWVFEPFAVALDLRFILCSPHIGLSDAHKLHKINQFNYLVFWIGYWAESAWALIVDHDDRERFGHYSAAFNRQWFKELNNLKPRAQSLEDWAFPHPERMDG